MIDVIVLVNERIIRQMEIGFAMSNLSGKEIKAFEKGD